MDTQLLAKAHQIAEMSAHIEVIDLVMGGFVTPDKASDAAKQILENGPLSSISKASKIMPDEMSDTLCVGILLKKTLQALVEEDLAEEYGHEELPEGMDEVVYKIRKAVENLKAYSPEAAELIDEIQNIHRAEEEASFSRTDDEDEDDYDEPDYDPESEDPLSTASNTYRQMHILEHIQDMHLAHQAATGAAVNEYTDIPLDEWSLDLYLEEFQDTQPLPDSLNDSFAEHFNNVSSSHNFNKTLIKGADDIYSVAVVIKNAQLPSRNNRPGGKGGMGM